MKFKDYKSPNIVQALKPDLNFFFFFLMNGVFIKKKSFWSSKRSNE